MGKGNTLINQLMEETYEEVHTADDDHLKSQGSGNNIVKEKVPLDIFLQARGLPYLKIDIFPSFFRTYYQDTIIDFPKNWSLFQKLTKVLHSSRGHISICRDSDLDLLLDIFNPFNLPLDSLSFCWEREMLKVVFFKERRDLEWIQFYFDGESDQSVEGTSRKAA